MKQIPVGIQLYSVRDDLRRDFEGTLRAVKEMGYDYVEFAGYYADKTAEEIKTLLEEIGLKVLSAHQGYELFLEKGQEAFDFFKTYGVKYIVIPWLDPDKLVGSPNWERIKADFIAVAKAAQQNGFSVLYHNHNFEFEEANGRLIYDQMMEQLDGYVDPQPDTCWMTYGMVDAAAYIRKYGDRINVVHLKDFSSSKLGFDRPFALIDADGNDIRSEKSKSDFRLVPLGQGRNDMAPILAACEEVDVQLVVVEQDFFFDIEPLEAMRQSREYLKNTFGI